MKIFPLLFLISIQSCSTSRLAAQTGIQEIRFGNGGGVTGEVKSYTLASDRRLMEKDQHLKNIEGAKVVELFRAAQALEEYGHSEPGNFYSFIEIIGREGTNNRIVWSYGSTSVDQKVVRFHERLMELPK